jgi:hypothetical protein
MAITNSLWNRVNFQIDTEVPTTLALQNNLFRGGLFVVTNAADSTWTATDNLFDETTIANGGGATLVNNYNGYVTNFSRLIPNGANDVILTNSTDFAIGPLGYYYYPTGGGLLSTLIDAGSTPATNVGLYHFTTTTNQVKEAGSQVNIGYHYVAVDENGEPLDSDDDGLDDWFEDTLGTDFEDVDSDGDEVSDYDEVIFGRNPCVGGTEYDTNGIIYLMIFTPTQ